MWTARPTCRATVRDGGITLNRWTPRLFAGGPELAAHATVDAALADLHVLDEGDELVVEPVERTLWEAGASEVVLAWARTVGFRRVWLPGRVVDLEPPVELPGAVVVCPTCGARWDDDAPAFWHLVRAAGAFPGSCRICGGSLPEWEVVSDRARRDRPSHRGETRR